MVQWLALVSYSGEPEFKSWFEKRLLQPKFFVVFHRPSTQIPGQYLTFGHDGFLPDTFKFIIHVSIIRHYII
jgi:hypothetical protein